MILAHTYAQHLPHAPSYEFIGPDAVREMEGVNNAAAGLHTLGMINDEARNALRTLGQSTILADTAAIAALHDTVDAYDEGMQQYRQGQHEPYLPWNEMQPSVIGMDGLVRTMSKRGLDLHTDSVGAVMGDSPIARGVGATHVAFQYNLRLVERMSLGVMQGDQYHPLTTVLKSVQGLSPHGDPETVRHLRARIAVLPVLGVEPYRYMPEASGPTL